MPSESTRPPFKRGDRVLVNTGKYVPGMGKVADVWHRHNIWWCWVSHGDYQTPCASKYLSLLPMEQDNKVVFVDFTTKRKLSSL